jgi:hypothetical protein
MATKKLRPKVSKDGKRIIADDDFPMDLPLDWPSWEHTKPNYRTPMEMGGSVFLIDASGKRTLREIPADEAFENPDQAKKQVEWAIRELVLTAKMVAAYKRMYEKKQGHRYRGEDARDVRVIVRKTK